MKKIALMVAMLCTTNAFAGDLNQIGTLTQNQFLKLSTDLGAASAYKGVTPATPLGALGFDIGAEITQTSIENSTILRQAGGGDISNLYVPKIHITKGLPYGFDIGAFVSRISSVNGMLIGLEAQCGKMPSSVGIGSPCGSWVGWPSSAEMRASKSSEM